MHYETYGVNIMKNISKRFLLLILLLTVSIFYGCSSDNKEKKETINGDKTETQQLVIDSTFSHKELVTVQDTIEAALIDAMERLRNYDNSGLYENEFAYLTDETTFDEYLKFGQIMHHPPGDVIALAVDSLSLFAHDSASVWLTISLEFQDGKVQELTDQNLIVYYHKNRWIKPTVSVIKFQAEYDDLIRQAEEASEWEDE